jgi:hypothetical protein
MAGFPADRSQEHQAAAVALVPQAEATGQAAPLLHEAPIAAPALSTEMTERVCERAGGECRDRGERWEENLASAGAATKGPSKMPWPRH